MENVTVGDRVICHGYDGTVMELLPYAPSLCVVRLDSGDTVAEIKYLRPCALPDLTTLYHQLMEDGVHADDCPAVIVDGGMCNCGVEATR